MADKLEQLLAQRNAIDRELKQQFEREVTVLFTDVVGSTAYFERQGDIAGVALLVRHNDLLFPLVEAHQGRIVKTIGDAIMAVFAEPADGVRCAAEMQRILADDRTKTTGEQIHVRVGLHAGPAIHMGEDVFGDAVNTAARVASKAGADEVLLSESLWRRAGPLPGLAVTPGEALALKGKAEPLAVVALRWGDEAPSRRAPAAVAGAPAELVVVELSAGREGIKVSVLDGARDKGTVKAYDEVPLAQPLDQLAQRLETFLQGGADSYRRRIAELGAELFATGLSERAREVLRRTPHRFLRLQIDDTLSHVPWELCHDGDDFVALRLATGRLIAARGEPPPAAVSADGGHALVAANLTGELDRAADEGRAVAGLLEDGFGGEVRVIHGPARRDELLAAVRGAALVHIAGHARPRQGESAAGFVTADGVVTAAELAAALGPRPPLLVFANSCFASVGRAWTRGTRSTNDLATALLWAGVRHFLGPIGDIPDADALTFALRFYEAALGGVPLGEAVRRGRLALLDQAAESPSFAGYLLYGDPRLELPAALAGRQREAIRAAEPTPEPTSDPFAVAEARAEPPPLPPARPAGARLPRLVAGLALLVLITAGLVTAARWWAQSPAPQPELPRPAGTAAEPAAPRAGLIRLSVLPFRNLAGAAELDYLAGGLAEVATTELSGATGFELVERHLLTDEGQSREQVLVKDILGEVDFGQTAYVDPTTRAQIGKLRGVEVLVVGGFQRAGETLRVTTRFVDTPTGRVLLTLSVDRAASEPFALQDDLAARLRAALPDVRTALRGAPPPGAPASPADKPAADGPRHIE